MTATDPIPSSNHDKESFWSQELVEYNDGALNLRFEGDGDKIVWGMHKYAQRPEGPTSDEVIITTKSGNRYFIGDGLAINERRHTVCDLRANVGLIPDVIIGEKLTIPGLGHTTEVASVELKYKYGPGMGSRVLDMPNPFIQVSEYLQVANDHLRNIGARHNE